MDSQTMALIISGKDIGGKDYVLRFEPPVEKQNSYSKPSDGTSQNKTASPPHKKTK
jgi:hypothetical protein